jgi:hypothetical protein
MNFVRLEGIKRAASRSLLRGYATRPLPRPKDPIMTSKNAVVTELAPGLTFIHRPPPTAPTPHSLTTNPASPLLRKASSPPNLSASLADPSLPPVIGSGPRPTKSYHLMPEQIAEMKSLRASDPATYTVHKLAKQFECSPAFVQITAPLTKQERRSLDARLTEQKSSWGARKRLQREIRQKRRSLW